jgi:hypothetical protein
MWHTYKINHLLHFDTYAKIFTDFLNKCSNFMTSTNDIINFYNLKLKLVLNFL